MEKVKLPSEVAEALERAKNWAGLRDKEPILEEWGINEEVKAELVAWFIPDKTVAEKRGEYWQILHKFGNEPGGFFKLIDALRYGYEIEDEPITVTVTAEMQEAIRRYFEEAKSRKEFDNDRISWAATGEVTAIEDTLDIIGLKIPGVNA